VACGTSRCGDHGVGLGLAAAENLDSPPRLAADVGTGKGRKAAADSDSEAAKAERPQRPRPQLPSR
jgi:hypothetical protein